MALIKRILGIVYTMSLNGERLELLFDGDRASSLRRSMVTVQDLMNRAGANPGVWDG
ncbi:hypothetical protein TheveDRAFT_1414 [Thermanaerovibrio velox DSM 12556]|uniref:Uncharacterized protein n=1 Tax=Thermanaerovibrio velox DSM 12556 TaxID=926567 RepID=H0UP29_9BACT|nr:hypothetical protein [Thermanaerovibrio velox]EHM10532.1 hypothetical protein TheveDRAFT_1414 [Thermanaerovibrio velox DSM 12556]